MDPDAGRTSATRIMERRRILPRRDAMTSPHQRRDAFGRPDVVTSRGLLGMTVGLGVFSSGRPGRICVREGKGAMMSDNAKRWAPFRRLGWA